MSFDVAMVICRTEGREHKTNGITQGSVGSNTADQKQSVFLDLEALHEVEKASRELAGEDRSYQCALTVLGGSVSLVESTCDSRRVVCSIRGEKQLL